jgi:hypothetical protein
MHQPSAEMGLKFPVNLEDGGLLGGGIFMYYVVKKNCGMNIMI